MHISAKSEYAIKAMIALSGSTPTRTQAAHVIADRQHIPLRFLLNILSDLRRVGMVDSRRGPNGGWWLTRPASAISVADVVRGVDGPLLEVAGRRPGDTDEGAARIEELWIAVRTSIRDILENTMIAELASSTATTSTPRWSAGSRRRGSA